MAELAQARLDAVGVQQSLVVVRRERLERARGGIRGASQQAERLLLERVGVRQVRSDPVAQIAGLERRERGAGALVEAGRESLLHGDLVVLDAAGGRHDVGLPGLLGDERQELVRRLLERLVGVGVREQLPGRVGIQPREQDEALAAELHDGILESRRRGIAALEQRLDRLRVALRLAEVDVQGCGELDSFRQARQRAQLRERLLLDRVRICEIRRQVVVDRGGHGVLSSRRRRPIPARVRPQPHDARRDGRPVRQALPQVTSAEGQTPSRGMLTLEWYEATRQSPS